MNPGLADYYRADGTQAVATVTVLVVPTAGTTVTVNGVVYTYGSAGWTGRTREEVAQYLTAAINADRSKQQFHTKTNPVADVWAMHYGNVVRLIASEPGTAGNSLTLATSVAAEFTVSGATFSGGTLGPSATSAAAAAASLAIMDDWDESDRAKVNPIVGQAGVAAGAGAVGATVQRVTLASDDPAVALLSVQAKVWAKITYTSSGTPSTPTVLNATPLAVRYFKVFAKSDNSADGVIGPTSAADMETVGVALPVAVDAPTNTSIDLNLWYGQSTAASQIFYIYYCPA